MANPWFRLYAEFATDPKVQMLSETLQRRLVMLFCLRCNGNVTLQDEEVTFLLRISNEEWSDTKAIFLAKKFINKENEILNWDKRQFVSDSSAARVAKHREKKKQKCNVTVTPPDTDTDTDTEQIKENTKPSAKAAPSPVILIANEVDPKLLAEFKKVRKVALTQTAIDGIRRESVKAGLTVNQAIQISIERGWRGFKSEWITNNINGQKLNKQEALERSNREATSNWKPPEMELNHASA